MSDTLNWDHQVSPQDHSFTRRPICPYCRHIHQDVSEWNFDCEQVQCWACGQKFHCSRNVTVTWSTFV